MLHVDNFIKIESGMYYIGISEETVDKLSLMTKNTPLKRDYFENASPLNHVNINEVYISKNLVTYCDFKDFVCETGYITEAEKDGWGWVWVNRWNKKEGVCWRNPFLDDADDIYREHGNNFPVIQVSWNDAVKYCEWASEKNNRIIRLPAEAEWEIFAGSAGEPSMNEIDFIESAPPENSIDYVNQIIANVEQGIAVSTGLIWEWTIDWFDKYNNGRENKEFGTVYKVQRGGSLMSSSVQKTREYRFRRCPTARSPYYGFRIAVVL